MNTTTTTFQCPRCEDRGVIHTEVMKGVWGFGQCNCQPPEYWKARSDRKMAELKKRLDEAKERINRGEEGGEV
jgi:hypothetical protein